MKKLLLLDADVIIDLHTLGVFDRISKGFEIFITRTVLEEARYFKSSGMRIRMQISDRVTVIEDVTVAHLQAVQQNSKAAGLSIDPGEAESIACLMQEEQDLIFCTCDQAAIKLLAFMNLEGRSISFEKALRSTGYQKKNLYPRHWDKTFSECIREGKTLRILRKRFTGS